MPSRRCSPRFLASVRGDVLIVVEAGDLPGRSSLRRVFDDSPAAAAIGCYPDSARDLADVVRESFGAHRIASAATPWSFSSHILAATVF